MSFSSVKPFYPLTHCPLAMRDSIGEKRVSAHKALMRPETMYMNALTCTPLCIQLRHSSYLAPPNHPEKPVFMAFVASSFAFSSSAASSFNHFSPFSLISFSNNS